jgi:hypothetical protein
MGLFGSGWLLAWQIVAILGSLPMVWLMVFVQAGESLQPVRHPLSLGTFGVVSSVWLYFTVAGIVSGAWAAQRAGWPWWGVILAGLGAGTALGLASGTVVYEMAAVGGRAWVWGGCIALAMMLVCVVGGPRWVG